MRCFVFTAVLVFFAGMSSLAAQERPASITVQWGLDAYTELQRNGAAHGQELAGKLAFLFVSVRDSWNFLVANDHTCPIINAEDVVDSYSNILTAIQGSPDLIANGALDGDLVPVLIVDIQSRMAELGFDCRLS